METAITIFVLGVLTIFFFIMLVGLDKDYSILKLKYNLLIGVEKIPGMKVERTTTVVNGDKGFEVSAKIWKERYDAAIKDYEKLQLKFTLAKEKIAELQVQGGMPQQGDATRKEKVHIVFDDHNFKWLMRHRSNAIRTKVKFNLKGLDYSSACEYMESCDINIDDPVQCYEDELWYSSLSKADIRQLAKLQHVIKIEDMTASHTIYSKG